MRVGFVGLLMAKLKTESLGNEMCDSSPLKRRRTKGSFEMKAKKVSVTWPLNLLPVEIFELITSYLPRSSIQNMRLVNKEFENKVSAYLFRVVVVPFRPEIYGITPEPTLAGITEAQTRANEMLQGSVMLQDKGMRVFQGFGGHIRKFAMSFEFDENRLANPPIKSDQEAITAFWGIYRWPFKKYNRYSQLEGLEQTADETRTMAKALRFIEKANDLGLSIDGGLGWLAGPDINQKVVERGQKVTVFGESKFVPEPKPKMLNVREKLKLLSSSSLGSVENRYEQLERMLQEAGYQGPTLESSVQMMLETEDTVESTGQLLSNPFNFSLENITRRPVRPSTFLDSSPLQSPHTLDAGDSSPVAAYDTDENEDTELISSVPTKLTKISKTEGCSLKPNDLTNAQREMLLEIEWAQRAFMQSYAIAIIDNPLTFKNVETLTIARLPNRHLPILRREDFWDGLPQLNKLSLAIIPDWRDVVKLPTSWVQDIRIPPSQSVPGVYQLLQDQISRRKNIKSFHFEWVCGGEEAPGCFARNQHILAAPLVFKAMEMINRADLPQLLSLPYVEHLSFKNCWISPHVLTRFGLSLKKLALQTLTLDSVSLTASLAPNAQPNPLAGHGGMAVNNHAVNHVAANNFLVNFQVFGVHNAPPPPPPPALGPIAPLAAINNGPDWLEPPRDGSWAHIIDTLTPSTTLAEMRYSRDNNAPEPPARDPSNLQMLIFKSCGYVRLPLDFDQSALDQPDIPAPQVNTITKRISDLDPFMMKPHDFTLGVVINHINSIETKTLENAWNVTVGWGRSRSVLLAEAVADGISNAGQGRFDGVIEMLRPSL